MSDEHAVSRSRKKFVAFKRAERRLEHRLDDIDWEYDVLLPQIKAVEKAATQGVLTDVSSNPE